jgi:putative oxidoreductase
MKRLLRWYFNLPEKTAVVVFHAQSLFLLLVRLYWGWQFAQTGWGKLMNLDRTTEYFASLNIPLPLLNAVIVAATEFVGGILLAAGVLSCLVAIPLAFDMVVAYIVGDREALSMIFSDPGKFYAAAPFTFLAATVIVLLFGPGRYSIDAALARSSRSS